MISINLNNSELKAIVFNTKEKFDQYRIAKGKYDESKKEELLSNQSSSEDTTKATKTYTEKIKGGYFGKRRSRF